MVRKEYLDVESLEFTVGERVGNHGALVCAKKHGELDLDHIL